MSEPTKCLRADLACERERRQLAEGRYQAAAEELARERLARQQAEAGAAVMREALLLAEREDRGGAWPSSEALNQFYEDVRTARHRALSSDAGTAILARHAAEVERLTQRCEALDDERAAGDVDRACLRSELVESSRLHAAALTERDAARAEVEALKGRLGMACVYELPDGDEIYRVSDGWLVRFNDGSYLCGGDPGARAKRFFPTADDALAAHRAAEKGTAS